MIENIENKIHNEFGVSQEELLSAKAQRAFTQKSIFASLVQKGVLSEEQIFRFFAHQVHIPYVDLDSYVLDSQLHDLLPENFCREHLAVPFFLVGQELLVAMANPLNAQLLIDISDRTKLTIQPLLAEPTKIEKFLNTHFGPPQHFFEVEEYLFQNQGLPKYPYHRDSERIPLIISVAMKIQEKNFSVSGNESIDASTVDVSRNGLSVGILTKLFLPSTIKISLRFFEPQGIDSEIMGEVVYCRMLNKYDFLMGVKFLDSPLHYTSQIVNYALGKE